MTAIIDQSHIMFLNKIPCCVWWKIELPHVVTSNFDNKNRLRKWRIYLQNIFPLGFGRHRSLQFKTNGLIKFVKASTKTIVQLKWKVWKKKYYKRNREKCPQISHLVFSRKDLMSDCFLEASRSCAANSWSITRVDVFSMEASGWAQSQVKQLSNICIASVCKMGQIEEFLSPRTRSSSPLSCRCPLPHLPVSLVVKMFIAWSICGKPTCYDFLTHNNVGFNKIIDKLFIILDNLYWCLRKSRSWIGNNFVPRLPNCGGRYLIPSICNLFDHTEHVKTVQKTNHVVTQFRNQILQNRLAIDPFHGFKDSLIHWPKLSSTVSSSLAGSAEQLSITRKTFGLRPNWIDRSFALTRKYGCIHPCIFLTEVHHSRCCKNIKDFCTFWWRAEEALSSASRLHTHWLWCMVASAPRQHFVVQTSFITVKILVWSVTFSQHGKILSKFVCRQLLFAYQKTFDAKLVTKSPLKAVTCIKWSWAFWVEKGMKFDGFFENWTCYENSFLSH